MQLVSTFGNKAIGYEYNRIYVRLYMGMDRGPIICFLVKMHNVDSIDGQFYWVIIDEGVMT